VLLNYGIFRIVQVIIEQNYDQEQPLLAKIIRIYSPYWFEVARCPPLTIRLLDLSGKKDTRKFALPFQSKKKNEALFEEITEEEIIGGRTLASALNFKMLGLSVSIAQSGQEQFGPVEDLSPLGDLVFPISILYDVIIFQAKRECLLRTHFLLSLGWIIESLCL
jgi:vacuolar protein sorting-associated protein 13A/C